MISTWTIRDASGPSTWQGVSKMAVKFTSHADYKSMKPYIDITESAKRDAVKKMEEAFNQ